MSIRFDGRVAIVTGAAAGLGRSHARALAARGAKVVVNDFGGDVHGTGGSSEPAERVAEEIRQAGGEAISHGASVTNADQVAHMVAGALAKWGRIDILINNAGILRDASFPKSSLQDFRTVLDVHLLGSVICSQAVWPHMKAAGFGRILMTTSTSGIYGNFGQANYGAAKTGLIGLMNVLQIEGAKNDIRVNALCPGFIESGIYENARSTGFDNMKAKESLPGGVVALDVGVKKLLDGVVKKKRVVTLPWFAHLLILSYKLTPNISIKVSGKLAARQAKISRIK